MQKLLLLLAVAIGSTGCVATHAPDAVCIGLKRDVFALRTALLKHPETPAAVGEAGTDVIVSYQAGCPK